ncbi:hypothetical protein I0C86_41285 [Plantactinospora sp. S1510]|uniref:Uncharacterized protein n=1 Tax=Plantactinospora alkalitolerans TaxID=2789879 RepID=A0ABS0H9X6_9ACTN|nr:hypothetical protein [Plantactinospora alkalitolerans]MBF9135287.1 hypothetical protein [Plantactinospora alkalitolerans]
MAKVHTLSDGTTIRVRIERGIVGSVYHEVPSRKRPGGRLMRVDSHMFLLAGKRDDMVPVSHPDYAYAADDTAGAALALRFFVEGAESIIREATKDGLPVEQYYGG